MKTKLCFLILFILIPHNLVANNTNSSSGYADPFMSVNYVQAFSTDILAEFSDVLEIEKAIALSNAKVAPSYWDKARSLFSSINCFNKSDFIPHDAKKLEELLDYDHYIKRKSEMLKALLEQLYKEKKKALWRPSGSSCLGLLCMLPVSVVGFGTTNLLPPSQQALALWPLMETINKAGDLLQISATAFYNSLVPPNDPLAALELE